MPKILIVDTYYPDFLKTVDIQQDSCYEVQLPKLLNHYFGTGDFYSRSLRACGWEATDIIANCDPLQRLWAKERHGAGDILQAQIRYYDPDVVFFQDLSLCSPEILERLRRRYLLAGQCSCPMPRRANVEQFHVLFTSFPHYACAFQGLGVRAVFNPLGFDPIVLRVPGPPARDIDVAFIGGVGAPSHWAYGMEVLETVAREIPSAAFFGYGYETLKPDSAVLASYQGPAWGRQMYDILRRSKIVINRHGEVAANYANNMRMFEATGCGAMLLTDHKDNLRDYFTEDEAIAYSSPQDAVAKIRYCLEHSVERRAVAEAGQARTLRDHTYAKRMLTVSETLKEMLVHA